MLAGCELESGGAPDSVRDATRSEIALASGPDVGPRGDEIAAGPMAPVIKVEDGKLTVALEDVPLQRLAAEVSQLSGVSVRLLGPFPNARVSANFTGYPLETGLRRLFKDSSTVFVFAGTEESPHHAGQLIGVLVLPQAKSAAASAGIKTFDEMVTVISEQLQAFAPQPDAVSDSDYAEVDPAMERSFFELGEYLTSNFLDVTEESNFGTGN